MIPAQIHESWHPHIKRLFEDPKMEMTRQNVKQDDYYPEPHQVFRVFQMPLDEIKVVILGQDPYPNGAAVGLAFAVNMAPNNMPSSLKIIQAEVNRSEHRKGFFTKRDISDPNFYEKEQYQYSWKTLEHWVEQGVFLLNTALTVRKKEIATHLGYWHWFTKGVIEIISKQTPVKPVWLLWGAKAQGFIEYIDKPFNAANGKPSDLTDTNIYLTADHPQAEEYNGGTRPTKFSGSKHFDICNKILESKQQPVIYW